MQTSQAWNQGLFLSLAVALTWSALPLCAAERPGRNADTQNRAANKKSAAAEQRAAKNREAAMKKFERRLGKEEEGTFIVALKKVEYIHEKSAKRRFVPQVNYKVVAVNGRRAAAERIIVFQQKVFNLWRAEVINFQRALPEEKSKWARGIGPKPTTNWKLIGRFDDPLEADQAQERVQFQLNLVSNRENSSVLKRATGGGRRRGGRPL